MLTGARQVGKTTLVSYFEKEKNYKYVSFDSDAILKEAKVDPKAFLDKYNPPVIFDEIQRASFLFSEIVHIVNETRRTKGSDKANSMFILIGSQKYRLMQNVSESMAGRVGIIEMSPLSYSEIIGKDETPFSVNNSYLIPLSEKHINNLDIYNIIVKGFFPARWENEKMIFEIFIVIMFKHI